MKRHSDVLIIGGGIIGLACAYYLLKAGRQVRVIEQDSIGAGASHGNCGLVYTSGLPPLCAPGVVRHELLRTLRRSSPLYIKPAFDIRRLFWLLNFSRKCTTDHFVFAIQAREKILQHSRLLYESLFDEETINGEWEKKGILMVFKTEAEWHAHGKTNEYLKPYGVGAEPLVGNALFTREPCLREDVYGAWHHTVDSHLRPETLLREMKEFLVDRGTIIEENCGLQSFDLTAERIARAVTPGGEFTAETYVLATGAWTPQIARQLRLAIPIQPGKGYSITMARPPMCPELPCYLYEKSVVVTPWQSGLRLGGTMEFSGLNSIIYEKRIQNLKTAASLYLKTPLAESAEEQWVGMRPMTYDDLPIIDWAPRQNNLILATGHGMMGISMAPSTGALVAELITGADPHIDPAPYSIRRLSSHAV